MTKLLVDDIMRVLRANGHMTTEEAAEKLGQPHKRLATRLGRMALYGWVDRQHERYIDPTDHRPRRRSIWSAPT